MPTPVYDAVSFPAAFAEWSRLVKGGETAIDQHASDAAAQFMAVLDRLNGPAAGAPVAEILTPEEAHAQEELPPVTETPPAVEPAPVAPVS